MPIAVDSTFAESFLEPLTREFLEELCGLFEMRWLSRSSLRHSVAMASEVASGRIVIGDRSAERYLCEEKIVRGVALSGYFQDWTLFEAEIRKVAEMVNQMMLQRFAPASQTKSGAIHLRLGDYAKLTKVFGSISENYVNEAVKKLYVDTTDSNDPVTVFSNEPASAQLRLSRLSLDAVYVTGMDPLRTLFEMGQSSWIVGSNSTFSWWSAAIGGFVPLSLPSPFLVNKRRNKKINLASQNVIWIARTG